jgi:hypothetical protein
MDTGNMTGLENSGEMLAPEVVGIEFRYFDGTEWRMEWDTSTEEKLPIAIQILLTMTTKRPQAKAADAGTTTAAPNVRVYSMVVNLPTGGQAPASSSQSSTGDSSSSTSSTGESL